MNPKPPPIVCFDEGSSYLTTPYLGFAHLARIDIYTDGACIGNPGPGGWAALICYQDVGLKEWELSGSEPDTTNNRMEMMGAIMALEYVQARCGCYAPVKLFTDSQYVVKGMTEWLPGWIAKGWRTDAGKPVKNQDLWERLLTASQRFTIEWKWVKGHAGNPGNERVDALANRCAQDAFSAANAGAAA